MYSKTAINDNQYLPTDIFYLFKEVHSQSHYLFTVFTRYKIHEPNQNADGDLTPISIGGQYYLFADYDAAGGHGRKNMSVICFTSDDISEPFTFCGNIVLVQPNADIMFAKGQLYLY